MARTLKPISGYSGVVAAVFIVAAVLLAFLGIAVRAEPGAGLDAAAFSDK